VSSFLTAHQHIIGYSVPYNGLGRGRTTLGELTTLPQNP